MAHALRASAAQGTPGEERGEMAWSRAPVGGQVLLQKVLTEGAQHWSTAWGRTGRPSGSPDEAQRSEAEALGSTVSSQLFDEPQTPDWCSSHWDLWLRQGSLQR